jgi:hypothetical protein
MHSLLSDHAGEAETTAGNKNFLFCVDCPERLNVGKAQSEASTNRDKILSRPATEEVTSK